MTCCLNGGVFCVKYFLQNNLQAREGSKNNNFKSNSILLL